MVWALVAACAAALGFAGTAVALAIAGSKNKTEALTQKAKAMEAQHRSRELEGQLGQLHSLRTADQEELDARSDQIQRLYTLLRRYAPDGSAAEHFGRLMQEAAGGDGDGNEDDIPTNPMHE